MCHYLDQREWQSFLKEERETEATEPTDDELTDEPERREPAVPTADD